MALIGIAWGASLMIPLWLGMPWVFEETVWLGRWQAVILTILSGWIIAAANGVLWAVILPAVVRILPPPGPPPNNRTAAK